MSKRQAAVLDEILQVKRRRVAGDDSPTKLHQALAEATGLIDDICWLIRGHFTEYRPDIALGHSGASGEFVDTTFYEPFHHDLATLGYRSRDRYVYGNNFLVGYETGRRSFRIFRGKDSCDPKHSQPDRHGGGHIVMGIPLNTCYYCEYESDCSLCFDQLQGIETYSTTGLDEYALFGNETVEPKRMITTCDACFVKHGFATSGFSGIANDDTATRPSSHNAAIVQSLNILPSEIALEYNLGILRSLHLVYGCRYKTNGES